MDTQPRTDAPGGLGPSPSMTLNHWTALPHCPAWRLQRQESGSLEVTHHASYLGTSVGWSLPLPGRREEPEAWQASFLKGFWGKGCCQSWKITVKKTHRAPATPYPTPLRRQWAVLQTELGGGAP